MVGTEESFDFRRCGWKRGGTRGDVPIPREGLRDGRMFRSINRNPGAIRADLSEISRSVSQVYEGYRCSAIRTRFVSNEDKCVLPTFHL